MYLIQRIPVPWTGPPLPQQLRSVRNAHTMFLISLALPRQWAHVCTDNSVHNRGHLTFAPLLIICGTASTVTQTEQLAMVAE